MGSPDAMRTECTKIKGETKVILQEATEHLKPKSGPHQGQGAPTEWLEPGTMVQTPLQRCFLNPNRGSLLLSIRVRAHLQG